MENLLSLLCFYCLAAKITQLPDKPQEATMENTKPHHDRQRARGDKQVSKLIDQALKQPGIPEVMEVYENWRSLKVMYEEYIQATQVTTIVSSATDTK